MKNTRTNILTLKIPAKMKKEIEEVAKANVRSASSTGFFLLAIGLNAVREGKNLHSEAADYLVYLETAKEKGRRANKAGEVKQ